MRLLKWMGIALLIAYGIALFGFIATADAHEEHGWKHMTERSGPIIGAKYCPTGILVWYQDMDDDGEVDKCTGVIFNHDVIHVRPYKMKMEEGINGTRVPGCSCEPIPVTGIN
eukprot:GHVR01065757.1.p2 GENE.GHVR01065757.1~~GHVR01065757.1.p2  ORF type:complete len:113 (+),score=13.42 GHVR01065757.1:533-871(+)